MSDRKLSEESEININFSGNTIKSNYVFLEYIRVNIYNTSDGKVFSNVEADDKAIIKRTEKKNNLSGATMEANMKSAKVSRS